MENGKRAVAALFAGVPGREGGRRVRPLATGARVLSRAPREWHAMGSIRSSLGVRGAVYSPADEKGGREREIR